MFTKVYIELRRIHSNRELEREERYLGDQVRDVHSLALKKVSSHCLGLRTGKLYHRLQNPQERHWVLIPEKVPRA